MLWTVFFSLLFTNGWRCKSWGVELATVDLIFNRAVVTYSNRGRLWSICHQFTDGWLMFCGRGGNSWFPEAYFHSLAEFRTSTDQNHSPYWFWIQQDYGNTLPGEIRSIIMKSNTTEFARLNIFLKTEPTKLSPYALWDLYRLVFQSHSSTIRGRRQLRVFGDTKIWFS